MFWSLLSALSDSERDFFDTLYGKYSQKIYSIAYSVLKNQADAEDAHNDVMINIINHITNFEACTDDEIISQIVIYSRNAAINIYNKNKRRAEHTVPLDIAEYFDENAENDKIDVEADVEKLLLEQESVEIIRRHVADLPITQREAITLVMLSGYSISEASQILHIEPNTLRQRIFVGRKKLAQILKDKRSSR